MLLCISLWQTPLCSIKGFENFATAYGFTHITSSPGLAQSNGEAERKKNLLKKAKDTCLTLLACRVASVANGQSCLAPHGQKTVHSSAPTFYFSSTWASRQYCHHSLRKGKREKDTMTCSMTWIMLEMSLSELITSQPMWITDAQSQGTVVSSKLIIQLYTVDGPITRRDTILSLFRSIFHLPHPLTPNTAPQPAEPTMGSPEWPKSHPPQTLNIHTPVRHIK